MTPEQIQELLATIEADAPDIAILVRRLSIEQQVAFKQDYEKRLQNRKSWDPTDEAVRRRTAAAFALESAKINREQSATTPQEPQPGDLRGFALAVARQLCPADAIVYRYLQQTQIAESRSMSATYNERRGKRWVPGYSAQQIHQDLGCFKDAQTVLDAINRLEEAKVIETERKGEFVAPERRTGRKRDIRMWLHVPAPLNQQEETVWFSATDAMRHGLAIAMLLHLFRLDKQLKNAPATDLAKRLPYSVKSIRKHRKILKPPSWLDKSLPAT
ncbi:MAG: hypothetical protein ABMA13_00895 [Chthoniobacteraceae bacterium]